MLLGVITPLSRPLTRELGYIRIRDRLQHKIVWRGCELILQLQINPLSSGHLRMCSSRGSVISNQDLVIWAAKVACQQR